MTQPVTPAAPPSRKAPELRDVITDALRYWEKKRLLYNAVLGGIVLLYALPNLDKLAHGSRLVLLVVNALVANVCFSAAYVPDVFVQLSDFRPAWLRWRWVLMAAGTVISVPLAAWTAAIIFRP